ncbi:hypothetical protein ACJX0J_031228, partial [Zea mays]
KAPVNPKCRHRRCCRSCLFFTSCFSSTPATRMEKGSGGSNPPPPPLHMEDFQLEGKKPVKNPFVPI